jgi:nucleotide-binding universal stress UspA family protein
MRRAFRRILVPHDFSEHSRRALRLAATIAGPRGQVMVLTVVPRVPIANAQATAVQRATRRLQALVPTPRLDGDGPRVARRVVVGDAYREIVKAARRADAIVICTRGLSGIRHLVIGSVAEKVVRHASVPVLSFRPETAATRPSFRTLLVPYDFSSHARRALKLAAMFAGSDGNLRVLHVVADLPAGVERLARGRLLSVERQRLRRAIARTAATTGCRVDYRVVSGDPFQCIAAAARGADAIVMSTRGRTGLAHLVIGSVAEKTVRHAPVPVLTIRPPSPARRR